MKYTEKTLWEAIGVFCPTIIIAKDVGVHFNIHSSVKDAAVQAFLISDTTEYKTSYEKLVAAETLRAALKDSKENGFFIFSDDEKELT